MMFVFGDSERPDPQSRLIVERAVKRFVFEVVCVTVFLLAHFRFFFPLFEREWKIPSHIFFNLSLGEWTDYSCLHFFLISLCLFLVLSPPPLFFRAFLHQDQASIASVDWCAYSTQFGPLHIRVTEGSRIASTCFSLCGCADGKRTRWSFWR